MTYISFVRAFPIAVASMPVSYDASSLLKCTVSMTYIRYYIENGVGDVSNNTQTTVMILQIPTTKQLLLKTTNKSTDFRIKFFTIHNK